MSVQVIDYLKTNKQTKIINPQKIFGLPELFGLQNKLAGLR